MERPFCKVSLSAAELLLMGVTSLISSFAAAGALALAGLPLTDVDASYLPLTFLPFTLVSAFFL